MAVHGGGGSDHIIITGRGDGPLIVYGDTSEDRVRYSHVEDLSVTDAAGKIRLVGSIHGSSFAIEDDGDDTIDATLMPAQNGDFVGLVIYGGGGDDTIIGSQDDDHLAGGTGTDTITGGVDSVETINDEEVVIRDGNDHIYGDSHFNFDLALFNLDRLYLLDQRGPQLTIEQVNAMFTDTDHGRWEYSDIINGGSGRRRHLRRPWRHRPDRRHAPDRVDRLVWCCCKP